MDEIFVSNVLRLGSRYQGTELGSSGAMGAGNNTGWDEEEDIDMRMFQRQDNFLTDAATLKRQITKTLGDRKRMQTAIDRCKHCIESNSYNHNFTISTGTTSIIIIIVKNNIIIVINRSTCNAGNETPTSITNLITYDDSTITTRTIIIIIR